MKQSSRKPSSRRRPVRRPGWLALLLVLLAASPVAAAGDAILGRWQSDPTENGYAHIEISRQGDRYEGHVVWLSQPDFPSGDPEAGRPVVDRLNPDAKLRRQPILGLRLMREFRYADGVWKGGRVYDPESGKTYKSNLRLGADGNLRLRGYIGVPLLGRTTVWVRAGER